MSAHPLTLDDLPRDGERLDLAKVSKINGVLLMIGGGGLLVSLCFLLGFLGAEFQKQFAYSWLFAFFFFFTISNGGVYGSVLSTPILNPPQSAILGLHAIQQRPVAIGDQVEIRPMMNLALSYDHRLIDGKEAVTFLIAIKKFVENPALALFQIAPSN